MGRVAIIVWTCVLTLEALGRLAFVAWGEPARAAGEQLYPYRNVLREIDAAAKSPPDVVFLGDSTMLPTAQYPSWAMMLQREQLAARRRGGVAIAAAGLDFLGYWSVASRIAALNPAVVVVVANFRTLGSDDRHGFTDMMGELDWRDAARTLALPYSVRGMTAPRLLMSRLLRSDIGEHLFLSYEGLRRQVQDAAAWEVLGPETAPASPESNFGRMLESIAQTGAHFDRPLSPRDPLLAFAGATVARLRAAGAEVVVVLTPVPWESLRTIGRYDPARFAARVQLIRQVVERHGGELVDAHHAVGRAGFRDLDCHLNEDGMAAVAGVVWPTLERALDRHPAAAAHAAAR